jgi:hypothetical protein
MSVDLELRGRPAEDEHIPYYRQYIDLVPKGDVLEILERQFPDTERYFLGFSAEEAVWRPAPEEWSAIEVAGHLADAERILMYRALRVARGDTTPWASVEFEPYVTYGGFDERTMADVMAEYRALRGATLAFLRGLNAAAWERRVPEDFTVRSVRAFTYVVAGHEIHHLQSLNAQRA